MKVIVCGAGQVGFSIARQLAQEDHDVTVIDQSEELVRRVGEALDVKAMAGFASHPDVLETAGAGDADMIIAVTYADEVNMVACQVAHSLFNVPTKIARVREQSYLDPIWADLFSRDHMPIDVIISPEIEVARAISRRLRVPGSSDTIPLADGRVQAIGVRLNQDCPILDKPLRQLTGLFPDLAIVVVAIIRDGATIVPIGRRQDAAGRRGLLRRRFRPCRARAGRVRPRGAAGAAHHHRRRRPYRAVLRPARREGASRRLGQADRARPRPRRP